MQVGALYFYERLGGRQLDVNGTASLVLTAGLIRPFKVSRWKT